MGELVKYDLINFVADNSIQTSLLKDSLQRDCKFNIEKQKFHPFIERIKKDKNKNLLTIIDLDYFSNEFVFQYLQVVEEYKIKSYELLINVDSDVEIETIVKFPRVRGVFYRNDKLETINLGIQHIQDGHFWFSRELSHRLIEFYRDQEIYVPKMVATLTSREEQVLKLLLMGASNQQIATSLFVSENTVKTHLHNVFKKIKVKNRLQALMWAKNQPSLRKAL
ncbi:MAG: LuxR C-terminal-related transcriptional regulator [Vibrio sp.]